MTLNQIQLGTVLQRYPQFHLGDRFRTRQGSDLLVVPNAAASSYMNDHVENSKLCIRVFIEEHKTQAIGTVVESSDSADPGFFQDRIVKDYRIYAINVLRAPDGLKSHRIRPFNPFSHS